MHINNLSILIFLSFQMPWFHVLPMIQRWNLVSEPAWSQTIRLCHLSYHLLRLPVVCNLRHIMKHIQINSLSDQHIHLHTVIQIVWISYPDADCRYSMHTFQWNLFEYCNRFLLVKWIVFFSLNEKIAQTRIFNLIWAILRQACFLQARKPFLHSLTT